MRTEDHLGGGDADWLTTSAAAILFSGCSKKRVLEQRDNGRLWARRLERRGSKYFNRRVRIIPNSFAVLYARASPFFRASPSFPGHRGCTVKPRVKLLLTLYWLAHGTSQFTASDGADVPASFFGHPSRSSKGNPFGARITLVFYLPRSSAIDGGRVLYCPQVPHSA